MNAFVLSGSRNPKGQTAMVANAVVDGLQSAGADVETVYLPTLTIERCRQCEDDGWGLCRTESRCIIEDDFAGLVERIRVSDLTLFATPVYFGDLSESMRAFLDRLRRTAIQGETREQLIDKPVAGVCMAGGGGGGAPQCALSLETTLATCGFDVLHVMPVRRQSFQNKKPLLKMLGQWLADVVKER